MSEQKTILFLYDQESIPLANDILAEPNTFEVLSLYDLGEDRQASVACIVAEQSSVEELREYFSQQLLNVGRTVWLTESEPEDLSIAMQSCFDAVLLRENMPSFSSLHTLLEKWQRFSTETEDRLGYHLAAELCLCEVEVDLMEKKTVSEQLNSDEALAALLHDEKWKQCHIMASFGMSAEFDDELRLIEEVPDWLRENSSVARWQFEVVEPSDDIASTFTLVFSNKDVPMQEKRIRPEPGETQEALLKRSEYHHRVRDADAITQGKTWFELAELLKQPRTARRLVKYQDPWQRFLVKDGLSLAWQALQAVEPHVISKEGQDE